MLTTESQIFDYLLNLLTVVDMSKFIEDKKLIAEIEKIEDPLEAMKAYDEAYRAGKIGKQHTRRVKDTNGNLVRQKAMVFIGESFDEALAREANQ